MKIFLQLALLLSLFCPLFPLNAQTWTGNLNSDWNNSGNWSSPPANGSNLIIDPNFYTGIGASPVISSNSGFSPATILVQNEAALTISANLTTTEDVEVTGTKSLIHVTAGTFHVGPGNGGRLIASMGGAITIDGGSIHIGERFISETTSLVTINNGTVISDDRLLIDLGGSFVQNGGTVQVAATFAMADGENLFSSRYELKGGTLYAGGEMSLENEAGDFSPGFVMSGGTLNLDGNLNWFGTAPGTGRPVMHLSGGTANITGGMITNLPGSTVNMHLMVTDSATLNFSGTEISLAQGLDSIILKGMNASIHLSGTNNWNNNGAFYSKNATVYVHGNTTFIGNGISRFHSLVVEELGTLAHNSPEFILICGDFVNNGVFVPGMNTLYFNGTNGQLLSGDQAFTLSGMVIDNSSVNGLTVGTRVHINRELTFLEGTINTSSTNLLVFEDGALASGDSDTSFVNGPVQKTGDDAFVFPIGKNETWARLGISATGSVDNIFIAEYFGSSYANVSTLTDPLNAVSPIEYWTLERVNTAEQVIVSIYWEDAAASAITTCNDLTIASFDGSSWDNVTATASGDCAGNGSGWLSSESTVGQYGAFTFGFLGDVTTLDTTICAGESYVVGTSTYTASGSYMDVLTSSNNTDSTVVTHLTVLDPVFLNLTMELCYGDSVLIDGEYRTETGVYSEVFSSVSGCDSLVSTSLTILPQINANVSQSGGVLTSDNNNADSYQWIDCNNNQEIQGETATVFSPDQNGIYALVVSMGGCSDTSACFTVNSVSLEEAWTLKPFDLYPNPSAGSFRLVLQETGAGVRISDPQGKTVFSNLSCPQEMEFRNFPNGMYFMEIASGNSRFVEKLIIRQ